MLEHAVLIGLGIFAVWHVIRELDIFPEWVWRWLGPLLVGALAWLGALAAPVVLLGVGGAGIAGILTIGKNRIEEGRPVVPETLKRGRFR